MCVFPDVMLILHIIMAAYFANAQIDTKPIVGGPENTTVFFGGETELQCTIISDSNYDGLTGLWTHHARNITYYVSEFSDATFPPRVEQRVYVQVSQTTYGPPFVVFLKLKISNVTLEDSGIYSCGLEFRKSKTYTTMFLAQRHLDVYRLPNKESPLCKIKDPVIDYMYSVGDDIQVVCNSTGGIPPAQLSWFQETKLVAGPSTMSLTYTHRSSPFDDGLKLWCTLNNSITLPVPDSRNCSVVLKVSSAAEITPSFLEILNGSSASFACKGRHFVGIEYKWITPNETQSLSFDISFQDGNTMHITNVRTSRDVDEIVLTCVVTDFSGRADVRETATLRIVSSGTTTSPVPKPKPEYVSITVIVVIISVFSIAILGVVTCLILFRARKRRRRSATTNRAQVHDQSNECEALSHTNKTQKSVYQSLGPEYQDIGPPDNEQSRQSTSFPTYEVASKPEDDSDELYEDTVIQVPGHVGETSSDKVYINHQALKGKWCRGPHK